MQMIEVRVRYQYQINRWKIAYSESGTPQALEHEKPAGKIRINNQALPTHLNKKAGVADEGCVNFSIRDELRLMGLSTSGRYRAVAHRPSQLGRPLAPFRSAKGDFL